MIVVMGSNHLVKCLGSIRLLTDWMLCAHTGKPAHIEVDAKKIDANTIDPKSLGLRMK